MMLSAPGRWPTQPLFTTVERIFVGIPISRHSVKSGQEAVFAPVLSVGDIEDGRVSVLGEVPRVKLRPANFERFRIQPDDVLVACRGTLFKVAPVGHDVGGVLASSNLITIRPNPSVVLPQIILALFQSTQWQEVIASRTRSSTGMVQITVKDIEDLPVPVPPRDVQEKLAELIEAEDRTRHAAIEAANARRTLVASFIEHALLEPVQKRAS